MKRLKEKLCSRKLWFAVAGFVYAAASLFGLPESEAVQITSVITAGGVVVAYILGESMIDASK